MTTKLPPQGAAEPKKQKVIDLSRKEPGAIVALLQAHQKGTLQFRGTWGVVVQMRILNKDIKTLASQGPNTVDEALLRAAREVEWNLVDKRGKVVTNGGDADPERGPFKVVGSIKSHGELAGLYETLNKTVPAWQSIADEMMKRR